MEVVQGQRQSLVIDFRCGQIEARDPSIGKIVDLCEGGLGIDEMAEALGLDSKAVEASLGELLAKGIIEPTQSKKRGADREKQPNLGYLWVEVTSRCNLNCVHCYASIGIGGAGCGQDLDSEVIREAIREGAELGCVNLQLTGGEPTLRKDLKSLVLMAKDNSIPRIEVFTNGVALRRPMIDFFAREEVGVALSFYSHREETHDAITRVRGSYRRTLESLRRLVDSQVRTRCEIITMEENRGDLMETRQMLMAMGVYLIDSHPVIPISNAKDRHGSPQDYIDIVGTPPFSVNILDFRRKKRWNGCWHGKAAVTCTGEVIPCIFARGQVAGDLRHETLSEIINGKMLQYWGMNKDKVESCRGCEYRYFCGDCPPLTHALTGRLTSKPPYCTYDPCSGLWGDPKALP